MSLSESNPTTPAVWVEGAQVPSYASYPAAAVGYAEAGRPTGGGISLKGLLKGLLRHWFLALAVGLPVAALAGAAAYKLMPAASYTARALIRLQPVQPSIMNPSSGGGNVVEYRTFQKTQAILVKSSNVLEAVTNDPLIAKLRTIKDQRDPIVWLGQELRTNFEGEIMTVALSGSQKRDLKEIVNKVCDQYLSIHVTKEKKERQDELKKLDDLYQALTKQIKDKRQILRATSEQAGSSNAETLELKHRMALERHNEAVKQLASARVERQKAEAELQALRARPAAVSTTDPTALRQAVDARVEADQNVARLRDEIRDIETNIAALARVSRNANADPAVITQRRRLAEVNRQLAEAIRAARPSIEQSLAAATNGSADSRGGDVEYRIAHYSILERVLQQEVEKSEKDPAMASRPSEVVLEADAEIENLERAAAGISQRVQNLTAELNASNRIDIAEKAPVPRLPDAKRRILISGGAAAGSLGLVLLGISWFEFRTRRVDSADDVSRELGLRLVGALPATPKTPLLSLPGQAASQEVYWRSRLNENVNAIRALLLRQSQSERLQMIMITSASIGEGKTSLACHLATSLARAGRRTLLLDCDLRSPTAHRVFDLPLEPGLSEVLRGEVALEDASHPIALGELRMITAGRCDVQSLHALGLEPLREIFERLRTQYEFIIVDTPPILPVSDPLLIGQHVDAALFSILRDVSRVPKVQTACERLSDLGVRILGAVVAGTRLEKYGADYYYTAPLAGSASSSSSSSPRENA